MIVEIILSSHVSAKTVKGYAMLYFSHINILPLHEKEKHHKQLLHLANLNFTFIFLSLHIVFCSLRYVG